MAVNAKDFSAAIFHISSLKNANTSNNTAASKQPNLFWFWEKYHDFFASSVLAYVLDPKVPRYQLGVLRKMIHNNINYTYT